MTLIAAGLGTDGKFMAFADMMVSNQLVKEIDSALVPLRSFPGHNLQTKAVDCSLKSKIFGNYLLLWSGRARSARALLEAAVSKKDLSLEAFVDEVEGLRAIEYPDLDLLICHHDGQNTSIVSLGEAGKSDYPLENLHYAGSGAANIFYSPISETVEEFDTMDRFALIKVAESVILEITGSRSIEQFAYGGGWEIITISEGGGFRRIPFVINIFTPADKMRLSHQGGIVFYPRDNDVVSCTFHVTGDETDMRGVSTFKVITNYGVVHQGTTIIPVPNVELSLNIAVGRRSARTYAAWETDDKPFLSLNSLTGESLTVVVSERYLLWQTRVAEELYQEA